ncbi:NAD(P)H dehydrogenase [Spongiactinospora gelatinilytica]|uniref:NAD(P)H dehydrogenase n=1 Tax=Spongiactinospora gelatinilytica TaxID=2666298 RepID=A0A2W2GP85_9ACTN|nr:NAD(P)H-dependent oxidoreductase [Spongiactinospora gelatinilytica]PZG41895.1 NAD(P)H dehydrogenase [Spongiactinospora gelatinilytica]
MSAPVRLAVIYYSATGHCAEIAGEIAETAEKAGAEVRLLGVVEGPAERAATPEDVEWADAVVFGTPTRFGNVSAQLKQFIDGLGGLWGRGALADKVYSGFVTTSTHHGGHESTLLALYTSIHHFGGVIVAPGYTDPVKFADGNPYGTSHATVKGTVPIGDQTRDAARHQARRVVRLATALKKGWTG